MHHTIIILTVLFSNFFPPTKLGFSHFPKQFCPRVGHSGKKNKKSLPSGNKNSSKKNSCSSLLMVLRKSNWLVFMQNFHFFPLSLCLHLKTFSTRVSTTLHRHKSQTHAEGWKFSQCLFAIWEEKSFTAAASKKKSILKSFKKACSHTSPTTLYVRNATHLHEQTLTEHKQRPTL